MLHRLRRWGISSQNQFLALQFVETEPVNFSPIDFLALQLLYVLRFSIVFHFLSRSRLQLRIPSFWLCDAPARATNLSRDTDSVSDDAHGLPTLIASSNRVLSLLDSDSDVHSLVSSIS